MTIFKVQCAMCGAIEDAREGSTSEGIIGKLPEGWFCLLASQDEKSHCFCPPCKAKLLTFETGVSFESPSTEDEKPSTNEEKEQRYRTIEQKKFEMVIADFAPMKFIALLREMNITTVYEFLEDLTKLRKTLSTSSMSGVLEDFERHIDESYDDIDVDFDSDEPDENLTVVEVCSEDVQKDVFRKAVLKSENCELITLFGTHRIDTFAELRFQWPVLCDLKMRPSLRKAFMNFAAYAVETYELQLDLSKL